MYLITTTGTMVRYFRHMLNQPRFLVRLAIVTATLQCSGCAMFHSAASAVTTDASNAAEPQSIDTRTQAEACRRTAIQLAAHEKDDHAIAQLERARELDPQIKGVAHLLAVLYDRQGRMDAADREYQQAMRESKHDADVLNDYGYFLYCRGDLARAEQMLQLALRQEKDHSKAQLNLGLILASEGRMDESYRMFEKAVGPAAAHHNVGMLLIRNGQREQGLEHLQQAAQADPSLHSESILTQLQIQHENDPPEFELADQSPTEESYSRTNHVKAGQLPE